MNRNIRFTKYLMISALVLFVLGACSKNYLIVDLGEEGGKDNGTESNNNGNTKGDILVTFNASVESRNVTRSMSPMPAGIQNVLFAFEDNATISTTSTPIAEGKYITTSPGVLSGANGYKMYLNDGTYNFYAVSGNLSTSVPTFNKGISEPLSNGIDYLWWKAAAQDIVSARVNIPVVYQHVATQIVFVITEGTNIKLNRLVSASITTTQPGATMNLATGVITPETKYWKAADMGIKDFTAQYIMLPVKSTSPMTLILDVVVNDEATPRTYLAELSLPDGELAGGNSYLFKAAINANTITFPTVSIKEWTEVDETGKPIYPERV